MADADMQAVHVSAQLQCIDISGMHSKDIYEQSFASHGISHGSHFAQ